MEQELAEKKKELETKRMEQTLNLVEAKRRLNEKKKQLEKSKNDEIQEFEQEFKAKISQEIDQQGLKGDLDKIDIQNALLAQLNDNLAEEHKALLGKLYQLCPEYEGKFEELIKMSKRQKLLISGNHRQKTKTDLIKPEKSVQSEKSKLKKLTEKKPEIDAQKLAGKFKKRLRKNLKRDKHLFKQYRKVQAHGNQNLALDFQLFSTDLKIQRYDQKCSKLQTDIEQLSIPFI